MRVLVTSIPVLSHLWDVVPIAWALRSAGHDVRIAALANIAADLRATGLPALAIGPVRDPSVLDRHPGVRDGDGLDPHVEFARKAAIVSGMLARGLFGVLSYFRPDLVVHEPSDMAGPLIAQYLRIPAVHVSCGPPFPARWSAARTRAAAGLRRRLGMEAGVPGPALVLDVCPPSFQALVRQLPAPHQAMRFVPYNGPGSMPAWLADPPAGPRVCITMGTGWGGKSLLLRARIARAILGLGMGTEIIMPLPPEHAASVPLPPAVRVVDWLPLKLLLARGCELLVHHGGPGTMLTGLSYGVPQLTAILEAHGAAPEHRINSRLLVSCGAGRSLTRMAKPEEEIAESVRLLLTDTSYRAGAQAIADEMAAQPSPAEVAVVLEDLVAGWPGSRQPAAAPSWPQAGPLPPDSGTTEDA
jgi:UDP:flavonoid glycosyltransferase YjiC (YdhE family)